MSEIPDRITSQELGPIISRMAEKRDWDAANQRLYYAPRRYRFMNIPLEDHFMFDFMDRPEVDPGLTRAELAEDVKFLNEVESYFHGWPFPNAPYQRQIEDPVQATHLRDEMVRRNEKLLSLFGKSGPLESPVLYEEKLKLYQRDDSPLRPEDKPVTAPDDFDSPDWMMAHRRKGWYDHA